MFLLISILIEITLTYIVRLCFKTDTFEGMILVLTTMAIFLIWVSTNKKITKNQRILLILAYLIRISIIIMRRMTNINLPYTNADTEGFNSIGEKFANNMSLLQKNLYVGFYTKIVDILYYLIGPNRLFAENINVLLSIGIFYNVFTIVNEMNIKNKLKNILEILLVLLPHGILLSASMLRKMIIGFFVILSLKYCLKYLKQKNKIYFFFCVTSLIIAALFHAGVIFLIVGYVLVLSFYNIEKDKMNISIKKISICIILSVILISVYVSYGGDIASKISNVDLESTLEKTKEINNIIDVIIYIIPKIIYFMFSHMQWNRRGFPDISYFIIDSLVYLFYSTIKNHRYLKHKEKGIINILLLD